VLFFSVSSQCQSICCCCFSRPVHGLIFLFKWKDDDDAEGSVVQDSRLDTIFFAKQVNDLFDNLLETDSGM